MTYKGKYIPTNPQKYKGNPNAIIFRSLWELKLFKYLDLSSNVLEWGSEEVIIKYVSPVDGKVHRYFVDCYAKIVDKDGNVRKFLIEVKPKKETLPPKKPKRQTPKYIREVYKYMTNLSKWRQASAYAEKYGMKFIILTEEELFGKKK